jgi:3-isopropylmalate dehydratase small subunit
MRKNITEKIWKFGKDIDTDQIIPTQYLTLPSIKEMAQYTMEPQDPSFAKKYKAGEFIVGGKNFGCGSSREQAPAVLKELGVNVIIAEGFARIFFRNCINLGILLLEIKDTSQFATGDTVEIDLSTSTVLHKGKKYETAEISDFLKEIVKDGGLVNHIKNKERI